MLRFVPGATVFGHTNHPVRKLLEAGITVGLGTDSLASNDTLSILDEMKFLSLHYAISPQTLLSMATINGAKALGLESHVGQIREGFEADLCGIRLPDGSQKDVYSQLFDAASKIYLPSFPAVFAIRHLPSKGVINFLARLRRNSD